MQIYVGNLDSGVTSEQLRSLFEPFGAVSKAEVHVIGPMAFGRVEMPDATTGQKAIDTLSGMPYRSLELVVAECSDERPVEI
jgi:RNA recognition motif-containing protein